MSLAAKSSLRRASKPRSKLDLTGPNTQAARRHRLGFFGTVKPRILALKAIFELGWDVPFITGAGFGSAVIAGAGKEASTHVIGIDSIPPASDRQDHGVVLVKQVLDKYALDVPLDNPVITTVAAAQLMGQLLDAAGPNPTRKALRKAADEKSFKGIWYGQAQMKNHRAWKCLKMPKVDSDGEIHAFGEVECPAG